MAGLTGLGRPAQPDGLTGLLTSTGVEAYVLVADRVEG